jgi:hypothetical protein
MHGLIFIDWKQTFIFFTLKKVVEGGTAHYLAAIILNCARSYGVSIYPIRESLITFGAKRYLHLWSGVCEIVWNYTKYDL